MGPTTIDRGAFDQTILPLQPSLMHLALGLTRDAGEARDLVQDAFERALREWTRFTPGTNARAWLGAILSRLFIDRWRRRRREPLFVDIDGTPLAAPGPTMGGCPGHGGRAGGQVGIGTAGEGDSAEEPPWAAVTEADLGAAMAELPPKLRRVFELSAVEHRTYADISRLLDIPVSTVGTRLLRARRHLRATLERRLKACARPARPTSKRAHTLVPAPRTEWAPTVVGASDAMTRRAAARTHAAPLSPTLSPVRGARELLDVRAA
jgi:RNA polymerase sigma-70 factor (ECF subfamily)